MEEKHKKHDIIDEIREAIEKAQGGDLITVKIKRGQSVPLLSVWDFGDNSYQVFAVLDGSVELARIQRK